MSERVAKRDLAAEMYARLLQKHDAAPTEETRVRLDKWKERLKGRGRDPLETPQRAKIAEKMNKRTRHNYLIACILQEHPEARTDGFAKRAKRILREIDAPHAGDLPGVQLVHGSGNYVPDAYILDRERELVVCFEVECHNRLTVDKLRWYESLMFWFDWLDWETVLCRVAPSGRAVSLNPTGIIFERRAAEGVIPEGNVAA